MCQAFQGQEKPVGILCVKPLTFPCVVTLAITLGRGGREKESPWARGSRQPRGARKCWADGAGVGRPGRAVEVRTRNQYRAVTGAGVTGKRGALAEGTRCLFKTVKKCFKIVLRARTCAYSRRSTSRTVAGTPVPLHDSRNSTVQPPVLSRLHSSRCHRPCRESLSPGTGRGSGLEGT